MLHEIGLLRDGDCGKWGKHRESSIKMSDLIRPFEKKEGSTGHGRHPVRNLAS